ncbi:hypothetical protein [Polyangium aurulentum]|uniref:hypothetical protein n=1 Tax=Polyangium aurulentum TaxID=2567896 RepID=UPI0010ADFD35|nr:hypothetical protein [Polyangium aurulentum]UQA62864.1 hypothetical protein E8A73_021385 [Polyangium aurulentum]
MQAESARVEGYAVPTYEAPPGAAWYHFLHGNVPGHQIDFMYRPEVPQGALTRQHFSHLARLMKYIEPRAGSVYAFAIANLSRDDTQYEPGRGGVAFIFGLRIQGAKDHAGRQDPPFSHAAAAVERNMDEGTLLRTALMFYDKLLSDEASQAQGMGWYHTYVRSAQNPDALVPLLRSYVEDFDDLPVPRPSRLSFRWTVEGTTPPKRVVIVYPDGASFEEIARCAARIAGVLVESDVRWTSISNGREADVPGGVSIRFVPAREAGPEEEGVPVLGIEEVPEDARVLAESLFGAKEVRVSQVMQAHASWRQFQANKEAPEAPPAKPRWMQEMAAARQDEIEVDLGELPERGAAEEKKTDEGTNARASVAGGIAVTRVGASKKRQGLSVGLLLGLGVILAVGGAVAAVALHEPESSAPSAGGEGASAPLEVMPMPMGHSVDAPSLGPAGTASPDAPPSSSIVPAVNEAPRGGAAPVRGGRSWKSTKSGKQTNKDRSSVIVVPD